MTVLIIEGSDLAGKGTAIEKISKHFKDGFLIKNLYKPISSDDTKIFDQYWSIMTMYQVLNNPFTEPFLILDRYFPSQAVYSYLRGKDEMQNPDVLELDAECAHLGFIYVWLNTDAEELEKRFDIRGDEHIKRDQLAEIAERYEIYWNQTKMRKIKINTMKEGWLLELSRFVREAKNERK